MTFFSAFVPGVVPSKKNSRICARRGSRILNLPSAEFVAWHARAAALLLSSPIVTAPGPVRLEAVFRFPDKRRRDLDNGLSSVLDLLTDCKIIKDDNWASVPSVAARGELATEGHPVGVRISVSLLTDS